MIERIEQVLTNKLAMIAFTIEKTEQLPAGTYRSLIHLHAMPSDAAATQLNQVALKVISALSLKTEADLWMSLIRCELDPIATKEDGGVVLPLKAEFIVTESEEDNDVT